MNADKTEQIIAKAIAALPYRGPSAGFKFRVMARVEAASQAMAWQALIVKGAGVVMAAWAALLGAVTAGPSYNYVLEAAPLMLEPGGLGRALNLLAARGALLLVKITGLFSFASDLAAGLMSALPPFYEVVLAALVCAAIIRSVQGGRIAAQRV